jgi:hypothetical protein
VPEPLVAVYRMHQPSLVSPCMLGTPCRICALHAHCRSGHPCKGCRRGKAYECERAYPTPPAFAVRFKAALQLVRDGVATFIHQNTALRLNFAKLTHLRDISCKVDGQVIWQYTVGLRCVKIAVNLGWRVNIATVEICEVEAGAAEAPSSAPCFT